MKKLGGVKQRVARPISDGVVATPPPPRPVKHLGGVKTPEVGHRIGHHRCYVNCTPTYWNGNAIHKKGCPYTVHLFRDMGYTRKDWECPYGCEATETPTFFTHDYRCPFWTATGQTPF